LAAKLISPSLLASDFANLQSEIAKVTLAGADWLHVDVMDGRFVDNITIGIPVVAAIKKVSQIPLDVHLMIEEPEKYVEAFVKAGSDYLTIHVESTKDPRTVLQRIRSLGAKPGITLRPRTSLESVLPHLDCVDLVLVMTVEPGFGGQSFMEDQVAKIDRLAKHRDQMGLKYLIEVDGGITEITAKKCSNADVLVAGSYIFKNDYESAIAKLRDE
jgi:ribulose-phosphate 3-epimerase